MLAFAVSKYKKEKRLVSTENPLFFFSTAVYNTKPLIEIQSTNNTNGRQPIIKPKVVSTHRGIKLAIRWITEAAKKRTEKTMGLRLYLELLNAFDKKGYAFKKKEELHNECSKLSFLKSKFR